MKSFSDLFASLSRVGLVLAIRAASGFRTHHDSARRVGRRKVRVALRSEKLLGSPVALPASRNALRELDWHELL